MAFNKINVGNTPNDGTGDPVRDAFIKVNNNLDDTYTKDEVDDLIEDVEVDLSNYDTKVEVDNKITNATNGLATETYVDDSIGDIVIPESTSDLINDGNGDVTKPFITIDDIPAIASGNIDDVLAVGNTSNRQMRLGNVIINSSHLFYKMQILNTSNAPSHQWTLAGDYNLDGSISIIPPSGNEGVVEFQKNSLGVIKVNNTSYTRSTRILFNTINQDADISFRNISGTVALLSDIPAPPTGFVPEAPIDGNIYGRSSETWVPVSGGESPVDPTNQNIARSGVGYKLITRDFTNATLGINSLMWGTPASGATYTTGADSVAFGENQRPEGVRSFLAGSGNRAFNTATNGAVFGFNNTVTANSSIALGFELRGGNKLGQVLVGNYSQLATNNTTQQFIVGIGTSGSDRVHGLEVLDQANNGYVRAPYQKAVEMYNDTDDKILVHKEFVEFYYTPRLTFDDLEDRVELLEGVELNPENFISMLDDCTPAQIDEIKLKLGI